MLKQHGVCGSEFGDLVQTACNKVACCVAELAGGKIWGLSIDNGLNVQSVIAAEKSYIGYLHSID